MAARWNYPQDDVGGFLAPEPSAPSAPVDRSVPLSKLNFNYTIQVTSGAPGWVPRTVWDDGRKTYVQFAGDVFFGELPILLVIERGDPRVVNYRLEGNTFEVDRLFRVAELRLGEEHQDVVVLERK